MTSSYQKISGFDRPHVSEMLSDSKISTLESGFKNFRICLRIRRMRVDDSRIQKEKVADSKISGYVWTGPKCIELAIYQICLRTFPDTVYFGVVQHAFLNQGTANSSLGIELFCCRQERREKTPTTREIN